MQWNNVKVSKSSEIQISILLYHPRYRLISNDVLESANGVFYKGKQTFRSVDLSANLSSHEHVWSSHSTGILSVFSDYIFWWFVTVWLSLLIAIWQMKQLYRTISQRDKRHVWNHMQICRRQEFVLSIFNMFTLFTWESNIKTALWPDIGYKNDTCSEFLQQCIAYIVVVIGLTNKVKEGKPNLSYMYAQNKSYFIWIAPELLMNKRNNSNSLYAYCKRLWHLHNIFKIFPCSSEDYRCPLVIIEIITIWPYGL